MVKKLFILFFLPFILLFGFLMKEVRRTLFVTANAFFETATDMDVFRDDRDLRLNLPLNGYFYFGEVEVDGRTFLHGQGISFDLKHIYERTCPKCSPYSFKKLYYLPTIEDGEIVEHEFFSEEGKRRYWDRDYFYLSTVLALLRKHIPTETAKLRKDENLSAI